MQYNLPVLFSIFNYYCANDSPDLLRDLSRSFSYLIKYVCAVVWNCLVLDFYIISVSARIDQTWVGINASQPWHTVTFGTVAR